MSAATPWNDKPNTKAVELPSESTITERTYGPNKRTADEVAAIVEDMKPSVQDMAAHIRELQAEVEAAKAEASHWKANHDNQVRRARVLMERTDMPLERVRAYRQIGDLQNDNAQLKASSTYTEYQKLLDENIKLKAERREFVAHVVDLAVDAAICAERGGIAPSVESIVEQELNK